MKKQSPKRGRSKQDQESNHARIQREMPIIMRRRDEISANTLKELLESRLGVKLRVDYLVGNMMGMKGILIDCEHYLIIKV